MYIVEKAILGAIWLAGFISIWFIPRKKAPHASYIFLLAQFPAWILGLVVVEEGWISYPVREFHKANSTSFTFEYLILPIICIFFNLYYPKDKLLRKKLLYYSLFCTVLTVFEVILVRFTLLIKYTGWKWYWTWLTVLLFLYIVRVGYKWFFRIRQPFQV